MGPIGLGGKLFLGQKFDLKSRLPHKHRDQAMQNAHNKLLSELRNTENNFFT